jgi:hypothetical protein
MNEEQYAILMQGVDVWNEWRAKNTDISIDLSGANLNALELRHVDLSEANLTEATFFQSDLHLADFGQAILEQTFFEDTNLFGAHLHQIYADGAQFLQSNLNHTILDEANLANAVFVNCLMTNTRTIDALWSHTTISNLDLANTIGLDQGEHFGPSYIDIHTLYRSKGKIPEVFLRGCGVPENLITYLPSLFGTGIEFYSCFISYSHEDKAFAKGVHDTLQGHGIRCWLDEHQMNPGDDIYEEVDRGIRLWDKVILCASEHSLTSWWVDSELNKAFEKERKLMKERGHKVLALIPLDLDGYLLSSKFTGSKKDEIQSRLAADFSGWERDNSIFERGIERVIKALRTDGGKEPPPTPRL